MHSGYVIFFCLLSAFILPIRVVGQKDAGVERGSSTLRFVFYNVENLFEPGNDPGVADDDFTPEGKYRWDYGKYHKKIVNIAKTLIAIGGWDAPDLIGLAEIENWQVLYDLVTNTPLHHYRYGIIHENSPDRRGIDTGVLYRPEKLKELSHRVIPYPSGDTLRTSRDILYIQFLLAERDTIHLFVNHWPSRLGGEDQTESRRNAPAKQLKAITDSLFNRNQEARIIIMGDFNDSPEDRSVSEILGVRDDGQISPSPGLNNLMYPYKGSGKGTIYHSGVVPGWDLFDQVMVSAALLSGVKLTVRFKRAYIFESPWLLDSYGKPNRSFRGPVYTGGYSDHLPVYFDLVNGTTNAK